MGTGSDHRSRLSRRECVRRTALGAGSPAHAAKLAGMKVALRTYLDDLSGGFADLKPGA